MMNRRSLFKLFGVGAATSSLGSAQQANMEKARIAINDARRIVAQFPRLSNLVNLHPVAGGELYLQANPSLRNIYTPSDIYDMLRLSSGVKYYSANGIRARRSLPKSSNLAIE